jgi:hypothetical protein
VFNRAFGREPEFLPALRLAFLLKPQDEIELVEPVVSKLHTAGLGKLLRMNGIAPLPWFLHEAQRAHDQNLVGI